MVKLVEAKAGEVVSWNAGVVANLWTSAKRKRAIETLFVEWVDGNPYSRWWEPIAVERSSDM